MGREYCYLFALIANFQPFAGSQIMKAWRAIMEEWEQTAKQIKSNAEVLESVCQDKLAQLYQDKRKARKAYHEEHNKIATQFTNVSQMQAFPQNIHYYYYVAA